MTSMVSTVAVSLALALPMMASFAHAQETLERTIPAEARGEVEIVNVAGDVQVRGTDRNEVQVHAELGPGVEKLDIQSNKGRTTINVILHGNRNAGSTDLVVDVPRQSTVLIKTVSADQTITDVRGVQRLQAVSGSINTQVWGEEFNIRTISGDVIVNGHSTPGLGGVNTVSGDVTLANVAGELSVETVTGDMQISMPSLTRGRIPDHQRRSAFADDARQGRSFGSRGDQRGLKFPVAPARERGVRCRDVQRRNRQLLRAESVRTNEFAPGNAVRFKEGEGNARVRIKTLNGGVEICK